jgi:hypothetical protein
MENKRKIHLSVYILITVALSFIVVLIVVTSGKSGKQTSEQTKLQDFGNDIETEREEPPTGFFIIDPNRLPKKVLLTQSSFRPDFVSYALSVKTPNGEASVYIVENSTDNFDDSIQSNMESEHQDVRLEREFELNNSKGAILAEYPTYGYKTAPISYLLFYKHGDNLVRISTREVYKITPNDLVELLRFLLDEL